MFLVWIIPLALIGLVVYGLAGSNPARPFQPASSHTCPQCHQAVQHDWKNCPHCGQTL